MLEGRAERRVFVAGQFIADLFAVRRINGQLWGFSRSFIRQNSVSSRDILKAIRDTLKYTANQKHPNGFVSFFLYRLVLGHLPNGLVSGISYWRHLHRVWGGQSRAVSDVKTLTRRLLQSDSIPDVGYFVNSNWFDRNWNVTSASELSESLSGMELVLKRDHSERGNHVVVIPASDLTSFDAIDFGDFVIQRRVKQHPVFESIGGGKQVTLRVVTAFAKGATRASVVSSLIKFDEDSGESHSFGHVIHLIKDGQPADGVDSNWKRIPKPDIGLDDLPLAISNAKSLVVSLHSSFPHFQLIGWDVGIDAESVPWIYEWNADHPAIIYHQAWLGPVLSKAGLDHKATNRKSNSSKQ